MKNNTAIFCERAWNTDENIYRNRLISLGFENMENILDAGGGCGQWSNALAFINQNVDYVEPDKQRVSIAKNKIKRSNVNFFNQTLKKFSFNEEVYNGIFCYSVIYFCNLDSVLYNFYKSLKKNGRVYICANNIEFYFYNIESNHNSNEYFDAKKEAKIIIKNTNSMFQENKEIYPVIYSDNYLIEKMSKIGFKNIQVAHEGRLFNNKKSFYPQEKFGYKSVYEIIAYKE